MGEFVCFALGFGMICAGILALVLAYLAYAYAKSINHETKIDEVNYALWLKEKHNE